MNKSIFFKKNSMKHTYIYIYTMKLSKKYNYNSFIITFLLRFTTTAQNISTFKLAHKN